MSQITWRNVNAPNIGGAVQLQKLGQQGIESGIRQLTGMAQEAEQDYKQEVTSDLVTQLESTTSQADTEAFIEQLKTADLADTTGLLKQAKAKGKEFKVEADNAFIDKVTGLQAEADSVEDFDNISNMVENSDLKNKGSLKAGLKDKQEEFVLGDFVNKIIGAESPDKLGELKEQLESSTIIKDKSQALRAIQAREVEIQDRANRIHNQEQTEIMRNSEEGLSSILANSYGNDSVRARKALEEQSWYQELDAQNKEVVDQRFNTRFENSRALFKKDLDALAGWSAGTLELENDAKIQLKNFEARLAQDTGITDFAYVEPTEEQKERLKTTFYDKDGDLNPQVEAVRVMADTLGRTPTKVEFEHIMYGSGPVGFWENVKDIYITDNGWIERATGKYAEQIKNSTPEKVTSYLKQYKEMRNTLYSEVNQRKAALKNAELALVEAKIRGVGESIDPRKELAIQLAFIKDALVLRNEGGETKQVKANEENLQSKDVPNTEVKGSGRKGRSLVDKPLFSKQDLESLSTEELQKISGDQGNKELLKGIKKGTKTLAEAATKPTRVVADGLYTLLAGTDLSKNKDLETSRVKERLSNLNARELDKLKKELEKEDQRERKRIMDKLLKG